VLVDGVVRETWNTDEKKKKKRKEKRGRKNELL